MIRDLGLYLRNLNRLRGYKDLHKGERCFILGNGPSLSRMDLTRLRGEITFGLNRIYLLFETLGFATTYLAVVNKYVIAQFAGELLSQPCPKFMSWYSREDLGRSGEILYLRPGTRERFSRNPLTGIWEGATVTFVAMQLAYYMGFTTIVLIGVDHSFKTNGPAHRLVTSEGEDENHFHPGYFGKGTKWQLPDLATSERAYRLAREAFESDGRTILDATEGGKLNIFNKISYTELFPRS